MTFYTGYKSMHLWNDRFSTLAEGCKGEYLCYSGYDSGTLPFTFTLQIALSLLLTYRRYKLFIQRIKLDGWSLIKSIITSC